MVTHLVASRLFRIFMTYNLQPPPQGQYKPQGSVDAKKPHYSIQDIVLDEANIMLPKKNMFQLLFLWQLLLPVHNIVIS